MGNDGRRRGVIAALMITAVLLALGPGAVSAQAATTMYVDGSNPSCSDLGAGTAEQPFCKLGVAAVKAPAGTTVEVAAGTYAEQVSIGHTGTADAPIVFTSAPGASVIVTGNGNGFSMSNKSWITINGFFVNGTANYGISVFGGSFITISNNHVVSAGTPVNGSTKSGIRLTGTTDSLIKGNTSDHNSDHGILITNGSARNRITGNTVFNNAREYTRSATGIRIAQSTDNIVDHNVAHDNEDSGIEAYTGSNNTLFYDNVTYKNGDHGIDNNACTGQRLIANSVYKNVTAGLNVEGTSTGATIENNIAVDNGINSPRTHTNIRVEAGSTDGTTMDYNLAYLTVADSLLVWNSVTYYTLESFQAATGQEAHGLQADPLWADPAAGDFRLSAGSPAIDSADSGASGQPSDDIDGNPRVDDPATADSGAGPRAYDDRGAYEFEPPAIDAAPAAALTVAQTAPRTVTADASGSTDGDATPVSSYTFEFGDGATAGPQPGATADHTYANGGTYTVTVTVTDTAGLSSSTSATLDVGPVDNAPAASLTVTPGSGTAPVAVTADASGSTDNDGTSIATYTFDFGDGTAIVGPQAAAAAGHTYTAAGSYTVTVTVADTAGYASTATASVEVSADAPPVAALNVTPSSGAVNLVVTANASGSTDNDATPIASYTFDFGDGTAVVGPQAGATAPHTYRQGGTFTVQVTVKDTAGGSSTATQTVTVTDAPPVASLTVSASSIRPGQSVTASASGSTDTDGTPIASYTFDFGDGTAVVGPQAAASANHIYLLAGTWTVQVTVKDTAGLSSTATRTVTVADLPPVASLTVAPGSVKLGKPVTANASGSTDTDGTPIASYTFDFGDGTALVGPQASPTASHTYTKKGEFIVKVTVRDTAGNASTATKKVKVQ
jgi:parallel beta-helix repeat protein